jgi:hypothetical protein
MKALVIRRPGEAVVESVDKPVVTDEKLLLKLRMIGLRERPQFFSRKKSNGQLPAHTRR